MNSGGVFSNAAALAVAGVVVAPQMAFAVFINT
jgi:hypothetical protein